jgi:molybdopterin-guanine dinucleotide biosynthesis protein A
MDARARAIMTERAVPAVILAGGQSRRMGGGDKCLLPLAGQPMLGHVISRLQPQAAPIALNANDDPARFAAFALDIIPDTIGGFRGPLAGVLAAMLWTKRIAPEAEAVLTCAADTPFFPMDLASRFEKAASTDRSKIVLATSDGNRHPVFGLWPVQHADDLAHWLTNSETYKVLAWVQRHGLLTADFACEAGNDPFFNINTPEDLVTAERRIVEIAA